mmetsp:Transcript_10942/g.25911  ORF Transcript_10942/g.25911 Transcript_10942/m.25911 type:complete len:308 (+) Transcript_10942:1493-2416(+)
MDDQSGLLDRRIHRNAQGRLPRGAQPQTRPPVGRILSRHDHHERIDRHRREHQGQRPRQVPGRPQGQAADGLFPRGAPPGMEALRRILGPPGTALGTPLRGGHRRRQHWLLQAELCVGPPARRLRADRLGPPALLRQARKEGPAGHAQPALFQAHASPQVSAAVRRLEKRGPPLCDAARNERRLVLDARGTQIQDPRGDQRRDEGPPLPDAGPQVLFAVEGPSPGPLRLWEPGGGIVLEPGTGPSPGGPADPSGRVFPADPAGGRWIGGPPDQARRREPIPGRMPRRQRPGAGRGAIPLHPTCLSAQ